jgi:hypothetical protein
VYAKPPFGGPDAVYRYLGRYTHRVAISNRRLVSLENGRVRFRYKDYADGARQKEMTLSAEEFIRRLLLHVLPSRFVRIRHYGLLASRNVPTRLERCRELLEPQSQVEHPAASAADQANPPVQNPPADTSSASPCPRCGSPLVRYPLLLIICSAPVSAVAVFDTS